ncbi:hypothetical protein FSP39_023454 [Pinctada imbricata]|uniref:RING-type domain-containing protein n=1 Tax=Pinctada imbricata TaxID=66713 RepID=A0AA89C772_PINIB|nr:hypothetical protein FSP39_023454 [Pinctada imbricata]
MTSFGGCEIMPRNSSSGWLQHVSSGNQGEFIQDLSRGMDMSQRKEKPTPESAMEKLGIYISNPRYPSYAVSSVRELSFTTGWSKPQKPTELARAGFFYAGYGDFVRCFFCAGGLRDWEPHDDPWVEHAHWFPKCVFLLQNKGKSYVEKVQRMVEDQKLELQQPHEVAAASESSACCDVSCSGGHPTQISEVITPLIESIPALSVMEMGYSVEKVEQAIQIWSRDNNGGELRAVDLMDIVFKIEDGTINISDPELYKEEKRSDMDQRIEENMDVDIGSENTANRGMVYFSDDLRDENKSLEEVSGVNSTQNRSNEISELQDENMRLRDMTTCKICMDDTVSVVFLPCGHLAACSQCAPALRKCPICRMFVKGTVRTFLS